MASIYALHNDKKIWSDPENFRPERFLNDDGKLDLKKDFTLGFGAGQLSAFKNILNLS
jgi:cytochrome P450